MRVGDPLTLFNGLGGEYAARIVGIERGGVGVAVGEQRAVERESPLRIVLAQSISRGERMDTTIQKAVELGVYRIVPLTTERSTVRLGSQRREKRLEHWRGVIISACEQSGRNWVPGIEAVGAFGAWVTRPQLGIKLVLDPLAKTSAESLSRPKDGFTLLIGPEGGLTTTELDAAGDAGFNSINLGPRVLCTETAALVMLSVLQGRFGGVG